MKATNVSDLTKKANEACAELRSSLGPGQSKALAAYLIALEEEQKERMVTSSEPHLSQARIKQIREISNRLWPT